ncbi:hypothetical protein Egran_03750 [Elaphomyces granulatus]|uniref:DDE-1 domain-containing protein n=1 Tax=Elaphomyces granulatus TaxID=519963 RepID=A0A232LXF0_9EURO|nr:hypothetical protein Egran_03750 [Elaphomyces granulatus]
MNDTLAESIHIAVYPSHSTLRLQPLDTGLFRPLASYYSTSLSNFIAATREYISVGKREFFSLFWNLACFPRSVFEKEYR